MEIDFNALQEQGPAYTANYVQINLRDLPGTMAKHAAFYGFVAATLESAIVEERRCKRALDRAKAQYYKDNKQPIGRAEKEIDIDPSVVEAVDAYDEAQAKTGRIKALLDSMGQRRDMLVQISARQNREMT